ncbi:hypothetical protein [Clostridium estertheticum]|uniref:Uncharacterized protein n=1 Tax=Clostridium estertheticum TaxID=238834 RepID=A0A7Y3SZ95_9CLOT|nr:hypothetical protein [Clostridium estertheticum]NNU78146.1 hypothetical protein [Clostridium estertheticum]WBL47741.1 hypothetical protein LOR37_03360 [Clostridium estertheticum]
MSNLEEKNETFGTVVPTRKRTIMPAELFESGIIRKNKELLKLLGGSNNEPLILTITSIYKDKESCCKGNYRGREFYNKDKLIAKYKDSENDFNAFVEGYLKALSDSKITYEINEEVFVD